jgi:predicted pyridoxine 5'-phosphate oxidase superfamily flavin-nucleotide-binding protein
MTKIPEWIHEHIDGAFPQNVCLVATVSDDGMPSIGPKGSVLVYDDETLAYWERALRGAWDNLKSNPRATIYFRYPALRESGLLPGGRCRALPRGRPTPRLGA